ncbi:MAG TPA: hypothetical protein VGM41_18030 [Chitinophagaceae bacterium]|jgi:hypothetical protein
MKSFYQQKATGLTARRPKLVIGMAMALCFNLYAGALFAQHSYRLEGIAVDTSSGIKLANATIYVLRSTDSMLVKYSYAAANGAFTINGLMDGAHFSCRRNSGLAPILRTATRQRRKPCPGNTT